MNTNKRLMLIDYGHDKHLNAFTPIPNHNNTNFNI